MLRRSHVIGFVILLVCLGGLVGATGDASPSTAASDGSPSTATAQQSDVDPTGVSDSTAEGFSRTTHTMTAYANGSVRWTTTYARPLDNESEIAEFRAYAEQFNTTETALYQDFVAQGESLAQSGTESTNRAMDARNFRKRAYVDDSVTGTQGKVRMSFLWTNLSRTAGEEVILGEAFEVGLYVGPAQRLTVEPGPELVFEDFDPEPDSLGNPDAPTESESITWLGEYEFNPQRPRIVFTPAETATTTTRPTTEPNPTPTLSTPGGNGTSTTASTQSSGSGSAGLFVVALIVLLLVAGTVAVYRTLGTTDDEGDGAPAPSTSDSDDSGSASHGVEQSEATAESAATITDEDLLTDTDRIQSILESNGGRMRQSEIVTETEWSKSKVSMLLSDMENQDEITKLRVGRENIISLPGHEPEAAGSPFEDEE